MYIKANKLPNPRCLWHVTHVSWPFLRYNVGIYWAYIFHRLLGIYLQWRTRRKCYESLQKLCEKIKSVSARNGWKEDKAIYCHILNPSTFSEADSQYFMYLEQSQITSVASRRIPYLYQRGLPPLVIFIYIYIFIYI